jgi:hypothetical protein
MITNCVAQARSMATRTSNAPNEERLIENTCWNQTRVKILKNTTGYIMWQLHVLIFVFILTFYRVKSAESLYVKILMCGILTHGGWVNLCNI